MNCGEGEVFRDCPWEMLTWLILGGMALLGMAGFGVAWADVKEPDGWA